MRLVEVRNLTDRPFTVEAHMEAGSAFSFEEEDLQIPAGGSRSVRVVFRPSERGRAVGLLYLRPCRKCSMRVVELAGTAVALSGTGGGPLLQASPAALDFGTWFTGRARSARLRLENVGEAGPIWVTSLSVEGDPSFSLGQPALPLDVSEGAEVDVWFLGEVDGAREGTLVVRTTWPAQPELRVPLYGEAYTPAECELVAEPEKVRFGLLGLPVQKRKTVRLRNVGSTCCRFVQALQFSGEHASHFSLADPFIDRVCGTCACSPTVGLPIARRLSHSRHRLAFPSCWGRIPSRLRGALSSFAIPLQARRRESRGSTQLWFARGLTSPGGPRAAGAPARRR